MTLLPKYLIIPVVFMSSLAFADFPSGIYFSHHDWELACDNTRTCSAAGYNSDEDDLKVSVLLTRKAGANQPVTGKLQLNLNDESSILDSLPAEFTLSLRINKQPFGQVTVDKESPLVNLTSLQVKALLEALVRTSRIELTIGDITWTLSDKGAAAVLLKMDEFQGRIGTQSAVVRKGKKDEQAVLPAVQVPIVIAASLPKPRPNDKLFAGMHSEALTEAILTKLKKDDCPEFTESEEAEGEGELIKLEATRLSNTKMLVSAKCWEGAYNLGYGFWVVNSSPPYRPILVTTSGTEHDDGTITALHKGRGLGDCWSTEAWTWDGKQFIRTEESSTGMCRSIAPGGAWFLPTIVTDVRPTTQEKK